MKKRAMVMAVAAMMAAGALTACGGGSKDTAGTADTKAAEETKAEEKSEETGAEASGEKQVFPARSVFFAVLPAAKSGILAGIVLGIGRAIGETMAVVMVAGNQAIIPDGMFSGVRTLTSNIVLEMGYATDLHREALIATAVVLFVFILMINLCFAVLKSKEER